jgi:uncharacterized protein with PIN domain
MCSDLAKLQQEAQLVLTHRLFSILCSPSSTDLCCYDAKVKAQKELMKAIALHRIAMRINVATWNVLADSYAYSQPLKPTLDKTLDSDNAIPTYLEWNTRKDKIAHYITKCKADIYCLQEVDHFIDFYQPLFGSMGYESVYFQRPSRKDGCLIAFDSKKYDLCAVDEVRFDDLAELMENDSARSNMKRSNVALIALMNLKENPDRKFVSSTAHVYWNPRRPEVKSLQTQFLVSRISAFIASQSVAKDTPVLISGDFNSVPFSEPYQMLTTGMDLLPLEKGLVGLQNVKGALYGPKTKFLCDRNLTRLCRWMRVLGIDTALVPDVNLDISKEAVTGDSSLDLIVKNSPKVYKKSKQNFEHIFSRARDEQRVILTTSKSMRERSMCPPSFYVSTLNLEAALVEV